MERFVNSNIEKQTIYEIFRACRLCGAGGGYKMPIIQNVVDLEVSDVELRQKIRECVQIEVHQEDKMPPLICELCVDKVNDFYEFLEMCRQTNSRTRQRLGLPEASAKGSVDSDDCILGVTEPLYVDDSDESTPKKKKLDKKDKNSRAREPDVKIKIENTTFNSKLVRNQTKRPPTPPRPNRLRKEDNTSLEKPKKDTSNREENLSLSKLRREERVSRSSIDASSKYQEREKKSNVTPKPILRSVKRSSDEGSPLLVPLPKRMRDRDPKESLSKLDSAQKKVRIVIKALPPREAPKESPKPKVRQRSPTPTASMECFCGLPFKSSQALSNHKRAHLVSYTMENRACNACGEWFPSEQSVADHHRTYHKHRPYNCRRCTADFKHQLAYNDHFDKKQCIPWEEKPDVRCPSCQKYFPTQVLLGGHKCPGSPRTSNKCSKCGRTYNMMKSLRKHENSCNFKKKGVHRNPKLLSKVTPMQIRVARCDSLIRNSCTVNVSTVPKDYGLDRNCHYPYISALRIKKEPYTVNNMVHIKQEINEFYAEEDYVHWDSDVTSDSEDEETAFDCKRRKVQSLVALTLKVIYSQRFLGRVPRKRRKIKTERFTFDSLLNADFESSISQDIHNIIDNLGVDDDDNVNNDDKVQNAASDFPSRNGIIGKTDESDSEKVEKDNSVSEDSGRKIARKVDEVDDSDKLDNGVDVVNGDDKAVDEDKKLMDAIDEQIGEGDIVSENKILGIEDLLPKEREVDRINSLNI